MENQDIIRLRQKYNAKKYLLFVLGLAFDFIGILTYIIPGATELFDVAWAPIAGSLYFMMYGGMLGALGGFFTFLEELFVFTDFIPSFTITWFYKYGIKGEKEFQKMLEKHMAIPAPAKS